MDREKALNICERLTGWFFYLLAAAVTFSNSFTEAATFVIIALWIIAKLLKRDYTLPGGKLSLLLFLFITWNLASFINTAYIDESLRGFLKVLKHGLLFLAAIDYFHTRQRIEKFVLFTLGVGLVSALDGIIQYIAGTDLIRHHTINTRDYLYRISSSFRHPNDFGAYLVFILTIFMSLFLSKRQAFRKRLFLLMAILPLGWCLLATSSRGAWLGFVTALIFLCAIRSRKLLVVFLILLIASPLFLPAKVKNRFSDFATINTEGTTWERMKLWSGAVNMVKQHPFLGFGVNTYTRNFPEYKPEDYPDVIYTHNSYLQMATETGIIGAGLLLIFFISLITSAVKTARVFEKGLSRDLYMGLIAGITGFLIHCAVDTHFYSVMLSAFLFLYLGLIVAYRNIAYEKKSKI